MAKGQLILDRYEPLGTAGAGGFGTVQIAWDTRIQRKVAIKTIGLSELDAHRASLPGARAVNGAAGDAGADIARWRGVRPWDEYLEDDPGPAPGAQPVTALAHLPGLDEARTAAKLADPRIVTVYDFEVRDRTAYLIMEYVEGITLSKLLARHGDELTLDMVAAVFDAVAGALVVAHKAGVLHLDIKPDNIIVTPEGKAKVTDFGLATLVDASGGGTAGGGTIGYMPLEQMRREQLDARTDEWSLASVAYEMLTGENPFRAQDLEHAEAAIQDAELVLPSLCWERIDGQVDDVVFYALDPDPECRYATVADFAEEMDKFLGDAAEGERELADIVGAELGLDPVGADDAQEGEWQPAPTAPTLHERWQQWWGRTMQRTDRMPPAAYADGEDVGDEWAEAGEYDEAAVSARRAPDGRLPRVLARAIAAVLTGYLAYFAVAQVHLLSSWLNGQAYAIALAAGAVAVGALGLIRPSFGVLAGGLLAGFALVMGGQVVIGAALGAAGLAWCLAFPRLGGGPRRRLWLVLAAFVLVAALVAAYAYVRPPSLFVLPAAALAAAIVATAFAAK